MDSSKMPGWEEAGGTGDDFMNMLPDIEYLKAETPSLIPDLNTAPIRAWESVKPNPQDRAYDGFGSFHQHDTSVTASGHASMVPPDYPPFDASKVNRGRTQKKSQPGIRKSTRSRKLKDWGLLDYHLDEDCVYDQNGGESDCETCSQPPCPSNCGETRRGSICCDADHCDEPDLCVDDGCETQDLCEDLCEDLCVDNACEGAQHPCTDENCLVEEMPPAGTREEAAAAAAALTSFGDMGMPNSIPSFNGQQHFADFQNYNFDTRQHLTSPNHMNMDFGTMSSTSRSQFDQFSQNINSNTANQANTWPTELFSHLLEDHSHSHNHSQEDMRPCLADNPNHMLSKCPLPHGNFDQLDFGDVFNQNPDFQCGFSVQDPSMFANHVMTEHKGLLTNIASLPQNMFCSNFAQFMQGYQNLGQTFPDPMAGAEANFNFDDFQTLPANSDLKARDLSASASNKTGPSMGTSLHLTSDSGFDLRPSTATSSGPQTSDQDDLFAEPQAQGHSLGPQNAYQCFWRDPNSGLYCLQNFENSDELDAHCRSCHTKTLDKVEGGFRCMWQSCKRQNDCFQTKAKLNRHLQTHTGFKPMKCPYCSMRLSAKQSLDQHIRTHTNEKPYVCQYGCGRMFKQHSALTMHHRTHTKEKPLKCDICGAVFTESSNLSKHRRTHMLKGLFECELCHKDFNRLDQLRRHLNSNHKENPEVISGAIERARQSRKAHQHRYSKARSTSESSITTFTAPSDGGPVDETGRLSNGPSFVKHE